MKAIVGFIIFVPLAIVLGVFAVDNRTPVSLEIWPLPGPYELWASVWLLGLLAIGILVGMVIGWASGTGWRRRARRAERRLQTLERRLSEQDDDTVAAPAAGAAGTAGGPPARQALAARSARIGD